MRDGFVARWRGTEYEASTDGNTVRLYRSTPAEGFDQVAPDRFRRVVAPQELESMVYERTACTWRGQPFKVLAEREGWLRVEYLGGLSPIAEALGLDRFDRGVYQGWAPQHEITDVRVERVPQS